MDIFSQVDCMVASGAMTEAQANTYKIIMANLNGLQTNDLLMYIAASQIQQVTNGGAAFTPIYKSADYTAVAGDIIMADTSTGPFNITLPASPTIGNKIQIFDAQGTFATNNLTILRNGELIAASATDLIANLDSVDITLIFNGGAQGWAVYNL